MSDRAPIDQTNALLLEVNEQSLNVCEASDISESEIKLELHVESEEVDGPGFESHIDGLFSEEEKQGENDMAEKESESDD